MKFFLKSFPDIISGTKDWQTSSHNNSSENNIVLISSESYYLVHKGTPAKEGKGASANPVHPLYSALQV